MSYFKGVTKSEDEIFLRTKKVKEIF